MKNSISLVSILFVILLSGVAGAQPPEGARPSPWSVGVMMLTDSQPYKDAGGIVRVLPSVVYRGERLRVLGPLVQYQFYRDERLTLNANAAFQFTPYDEDDSRIFEGMDEPDPTVVVGLDGRISLQDILSPKFSLLFTAEGDVLNEHNGVQLTLGGSYSLGHPRAPISGGLGAGLLWQSANWTNYFVGVPLKSQTEERPAYEASSSVNPYISIRLMYNFNRNWSVMGIARMEWLDNSWTDSPLVADDTRTVTFVGLNYTF